MERIVEYLITSEYAGGLLLDFLRKKGFSRNILVSMKQETRALLCNGETARGNRILQNGDRLRVTVPEAAPSEKIRPVKMDLKILYEDEDLLILNKGADVPVHPSIGNHENSLANGAAAYYASQGKDFVFRCINRLDRDTTGALILAKNPLSAAVLSAQMKRREIRRTYLAIVQGVTPKRGTVSVPIARKKGSVLLREANENGAPAVTHYERLSVTERRIPALNTAAPGIAALEDAASADAALGETASADAVSKTAAYENTAAGTAVPEVMQLSLLELHLETGRTHQIRVHMRYLGHPLPGDYLYNPDYRLIRRQPLHSYQLDFTHPVTGIPMCVTAPVPEDFVRAWEFRKAK